MINRIMVWAKARWVRVLVVAVAVLGLGVSIWRPWLGGSTVAAAPSPSASPAPVFATKSEVERMVKAGVSAFSATVNTSISVEAERITSLEAAVGDGQSALVARVSSIESELTTATRRVDALEAAAEARLNAEWKLQEPIRLTASGERWQMAPDVQKDGRGWTFRKPKNAVKANFGKVCEAFAKQYQRAVAGYSGIPEKGKEELAGLLFAKSDAVDQFTVVSIDQAQYGLVANILATTRGEVASHAKTIRLANEVLTPINPENGMAGYGDSASPAPVPEAHASASPVAPAPAPSATPTVVPSPAPTTPAVTTAEPPGVSEVQMRFAPKRLRFRRSELRNPTLRHASTLAAAYRRDGKIFRIRKDLVASECGGYGTPYFLHEKCDHCASTVEEGWGRSPMREDGDYWVADCPVSTGTKCNVWVKGGEYFPDHRHVGQQDVLAHRTQGADDTGAWLVLR